MNSIFSKKSASIVLFILVSCQIKSQTYSPKYEFGIGVGTLIYQGDLTPSYFGSYNNLKPSLHIFGSRILDNSFSIRANFISGSISGNDSWYSTPAYRRLRNFNFSSSINELSAGLVWNFYSYSVQGNKKKFSTYIFGGAGLTFLNIKRDWSKMDTSAFPSKSSVAIGLGIDTVHKLPSVIPVIPIGVGLKYAISENFSLFAEATYRVSFTDYLDGFSKSADPSKKDSYYGYSIGIIYSPSNSGIRCPRVRR